ncbi:hypothetical protein FD15_GL002229 [Liquorilactobacillus sucicola DSM 21376 = JCM 15457]|uniref:DUF1722 domain-containing protein n=1 Tax=Liquorilactobacillus sucicola DSM 21376 = JCM 15457 TaxID=1423806 RepID=A0A0R2DNF5_9LACO|nr:hypothetical protein FD15_GL002229 [Liquorilactobacillus sucicola DSM 21376 = JCM 15457]
MWERFNLIKWQHSWAVNKYWVMARSQRIYNEIRKLASGNDWTKEKETTYQKLLLEADRLVPTVQTLTTAYQHVWGYFKKIATTDEKNFYMHELAVLAPESDRLGPFLAKLALKYDVHYLLQSRLMKTYLK